MKKALIVVDVQNDFCEGGALAVPGGNEVAERIARYISYMNRPDCKWYDEIVFTQDCHKPLPDTNGGHFADPPDFIDSWPVHCVAGTKGARLHPEIEGLARDMGNVFQKGYGKPDYSGFQGYAAIYDYTLDEFLKGRGIKAVDVAGLAGDYCVRATALDAVKNGYLTAVLPNLVASIGGDAATTQTIKEVGRAF